MPKIPDCDRCLDFRPNPNIEEQQQWSPEKYIWYSDELLSIRASRYTAQEQAEILDNHPFFTGICPQCSHQFAQSSRTIVHFDCRSCSYIDDSV
jgi:hypothetical protein